MLNNYLFYNLNQCQIEIEELQNSEILTDLKAQPIKCYNSFFPQTKVEICQQYGKLIFIKKKKVFGSKNVLQLFYCIKKKQTDKSITYNIFNLEIKHQMEINISLNDENKFCFIFKDYFIFTDLQNQIKFISLIDEGLYVKNYKVQLTQSQEQKLKRNKFYAKVYDKQTIQQENLQQDLINTIQQYKRVQDSQYFLKPFIFFENQQYFVIIFSLSLVVSFDKFLEINPNLTEDAILINITRSLIQVFIDLEKKQIVLPIVNPNNIFVTLYTFNKILFNHHQKIYANLKKLISKNSKTSQNDGNKRFSNALKFNSDDDVQQQNLILENIEELELANNTDVNNFLLIFTNTEFLFKQKNKFQTQSDYLQVGYQKIKFLSNLFTNLTNNLNCINIGLLYFYIISRQNFGIPVDFIKKSNTEEDTFYINFPINIINKLSLIQQQILFYLFTMDDLKLIDKKLDKFINFEAKIYEIDQKEKSISINTSKEEEEVGEGSEIQQSSQNSEESEDFDINATKSLTIEENRSKSKIKQKESNACESLKNLYEFNKNSYQQLQQNSDHLDLPKKQIKNALSSIGSPEKNQQSQSFYQESQQSLEQLNETLGLIQKKTESLKNSSVKTKENTAPDFLLHNMESEVHENSLFNFFKKKNPFKPKFINKSITSEESDENIYQTIEEISELRTPRAQSDLSDVSNLIQATQKLKPTSMNFENKENEQQKTHITRTEKIEDFFRNFLLKNNLEKTLDIFQVEWYELSQKKTLNDQSKQTLPDVFLENQKLEDTLKVLRKELDDARIFANKTKLTWEKLRKERDFHKLHHSRVQQEKEKLIKQLAKLKDFHLHYEQKYQELCSKYESAMKEKMLLKLERDRLSTKTKSLKESLDVLQQKTSLQQKENQIDSNNSQKSKKSRKDLRNSENPSLSKIPKPLINPFELDKIQPVLQKQVNALKTFKGHMQTISKMSIHQKKPFLATASDDMTWKIWSLPKGELIMSGEGHNDWISDVSFHPKGTHLATASGDATIKLWDFLNISCAWTIKDHSQPIWALDFDFSGDFLIAGGMDHSIKLYDVPCQKSRYNFRGHVDSVNAVNFSRYQNWFLSGSSDKTVSLWDIRTGLLQNTFFGHGGSVNGISVSEAEKEVLSCDSEGVVKLWDLRMMKARGEVNCGPHSANGVTLDPSAELGFVASDEGSVVVIDLEKFELQGRLKGHEDAVQDIVFDAFNKQLVTCSADLTFRTWA